MQILPKQNQAPFKVKRKSLIDHHKQNPKKNFLKGFRNKSETVIILTFTIYSGDFCLVSIE